MLVCFTRLQDGKYRAENLLQDFLHYPLSKAGQSMKTPNSRMNYGFKADRASQKLVVNAFKENAKANSGIGTDLKTLTLCKPQNVFLHSATLGRDFPSDIFSNPKLTKMKLSS